MLVLCGILIAGLAPMATFARFDEFGGGAVKDYLPYTEFLPYTENHTMPPEADAMGVHLADEPHAGRVHNAGRFLLSSEATPGKTVLVVRNGSLYELTHR